VSSIQGEIAIFHDENRLMKFQGKRVQEGVGYDDKQVHGKRPKLGEVSSDVEPSKFLDLCENLAFMFFLLSSLNIFRDRC
jgi:hypothetical protein